MQIVNHLDVYLTWTFIVVSAPNIKLWVFSHLRLYDVL